MSDFANGCLSVPYVILLSSLYIKEPHHEQNSICLVNLFLAIAVSTSTCYEHCCRHLPCSISRVCVHVYLPSCDIRGRSHAHIILSAYLLVSNLALNFFIVFVWTPSFFSSFQTSMPLDRKLFFLIFSMSIPFQSFPCSLGFFVFHITKSPLFKYSMSIITLHNATTSPYSLHCSRERR